MSTDLEIRRVERPEEANSEAGCPSMRMRKAVVIIEQEMMSRGHLRELIEQEGFEPVTFSDAYEMVRHLDERSEEIKAVFIDSSIFAVVERTLVSMLSKGKSRVRLILTGSEFSGERVHQWIEMGVHGCVQRPYSAEEIAAFLH